MGNFLALVKNENMKIYRRPRTYVMMGIIVGLVLLISILWLSFGGSDTSMWEVAYLETTILYMLVTIFAVIIAASIVAEEFSTGTIKLLLIRPWSRSKILLSKYIAVLLFTLLFAVLLLAATLLVNWLCFSLFSSTSTSSDIMGLAKDESPISYLLKTYGLTFISTIMTVTMAFMLSTIFRSSALAIGMALFLLLVVNNLLMLLAALKYKWIDYVLFIHLNLTQYLSDFPMREGMTLQFSLIVLACYWVVFVALTWYIFNKRDVAA
ncbi:MULTISPECIES: ABC transporter permease [unclassified Paenibacillus]|uniref:ABC transporter permease n=1 Tax=unclassified Paenibacillus TaxID=185978 RepID=UPI002F408541